MSKKKTLYYKLESGHTEDTDYLPENTTGTPSKASFSKIKLLPYLLNTISLGIVKQRIGDSFPEWIRGARLSVAYGGLHLQLLSSKRIEREDLVELQSLLRVKVDFPLAVRVIYETPEAKTPFQEKILVVTPLKNGNTSPIMNHESHAESFLNPIDTLQVRSLARSRKQRKRALNQLSFREEIERTVPAGTRLWKTSFYQMQRGERALQFVVLRMYVPEDQQEQIQSWRGELERKFRVGILIQRERVSEGITRQLTMVSDGDGILRDPEKAGRLITDIYGAPPAAARIPGRRRRRSRAALEDLTDYNFLTIDPAGARDLDDALWAERLPGKRYRILVSFADVTEAVLPGSTLDHYAKKVCFSLYGRFSSIPLLGEEFGYKKLSLLPGQKRLCWTVELEVDGQGRVLGSRFFRALVKSSAQLSFEEVGSLEKIRPDLTGEVDTLRDVTYLLRQKRLSRAGFIKFKSEGDSYFIVEECMLAAKAVIARTFEEAGVPILFKVHAPPGKILRKRFIREIKAVGIKARKKDFTEPMRFREILSSLQQMGEMKLFHRILDAYLKKARYDVENRGHHGLGLDAYTEIKGLRNYAGLLNQRQAAHLLCGRDSLSEEELGKYQYHVNRKHRIYHDNSIRLITFEAIRERLAMTGQVFCGEITEIHPEGILIDLPGFYSEGLIPLQIREQPPEFQQRWIVGAIISVELVGYDPLCKRYIFSF